jgi:hypothetical protein
MEVIIFYLSTKNFKLKLYALGRSLHQSRQAFLRFCVVFISTFTNNPSSVPLWFCCIVHTNKRHWYGILEVNVVKPYFREYLEIKQKNK